MDLREQLARDLLGAPYGELTSQKKSVIDLIADQKPSGLGPLARLDERDRWAGPAPGWDRWDRSVVVRR